MPRRIAKGCFINGNGPSNDVKYHHNLFDSFHNTFRFNHSKVLELDILKVMVAYSMILLMMPIRYLERAQSSLPESGKRLLSKMGRKNLRETKSR